MEKICMFRGAKILVDVCANLQPHENVIIVTDKRESSIVDSLAMATIEREAEVTICTMTPMKGHGFDLPKPIAQAMLAADVIFAPTSEYSISHSTARINACKAGARYINMAGYRDSMLISGGLFADFLGLVEPVKRVGDLFTEPNEAIIISKNGATISFSIKGRRGNSKTGLARNPGDTSFPPAITAYTTPIEGVASGKILIDGSIPMKGVGILSQPIELKIENGRIVEIEGGYEGKLLQEYLSTTGEENAFMISEIGIGLNPKCRLSGTLLEDEGILGSVHLGVGENMVMGGSNKASIHLDMILVEATLVLDNVTIIDRGKIMLEEWKDR